MHFGRLWYQKNNKNGVLALTFCFLFNILDNIRRMEAKNERCQDQYQDKRTRT